MKSREEKDNTKKRKFQTVDPIIDLCDSDEEEKKKIPLKKKDNHVDECEFVGEASSNQFFKRNSTQNEIQRRGVQIAPQTKKRRLMLEAYEKRQNSQLKNSENLSNSFQNAAIVQMVPTISDQISSYRKKMKQKHVFSRNETKKIHTLNDLRQKEEDQKHHKMTFDPAKFSSSSSVNTIHTISNSILSPETISRECVELTNQFRKQNKLEHVIYSAPLSKVGLVHSKNMGDKKVQFGHAGQLIFSTHLANCNINC